MKPTLTVSPGKKSYFDAVLLAIISYFIFTIASRSAESDSYERLMVFLYAVIFIFTMVLAHRFIFAKSHLDDERIWETYVLPIPLFNRTVRFDEIERFFVGTHSRGMSEYLIVRTKDGKHRSILFSNLQIQEAFRKKAQELGLKEVESRFQLW